MSTARKIDVSTETEPKRYPRRQGVPTKRIGVGGPRAALNITQEQIAERMGVSQSHVSKIESTDDAIQVSTLRAYAEAVGGVLEVCITINGLRLRVL
jgi:predicted transcriptional regulator